MLTRLGHFTVRRRRLVLSFTVLFMLVGAVIGTRVFGVLEGGGFEDPSSESARAGDALDRDFDTGEYDLVLVATAAGGDVDAPGAVAAGEALAAKVAAVPGVQEVASYWSLARPPTLRSDSGDRAMVLVRIDDSEEAAEDVVDGVRDAVDGEQGGLIVAVGGGEAVSADITSTIEGDLGRAEAIAIPITLVLLVLVFGGLIAASLPLFVGVLAVLGTFLSLYVIGSLTDVSVYAINLTTALGLGLAIDYSLFIVSRYREELRHGASVEDAVVRTVETAGRTIAISALTVAVSLSALLVFPQYFLRSFAYAGIAVVLLAMAGAIVALPALLAIVGHRIDSLRVLRRQSTEARGGRVLVPHGDTGHASPGSGGDRGGRRAPAARVTVPPGAVRHARRSRASGIGALAGGLGDPAHRLRGRHVGVLPGRGHRHRRRRRRRPSPAWPSQVSALAGVARVETSTGTFAGGDARRDRRGRRRPLRPSGLRLDVGGADVRHGVE